MTPEDMRWHNQPWDPSPDEIERGCAQIRESWSPRERRLRSTWAASAPWTVPATRGFEAPDDALSEPELDSPINWRRGPAAVQRMAEGC